MSQNTFNGSMTKITLGVIMIAVQSKWPKVLFHQQHIRNSSKYYYDDSGRVNTKRYFNNNVIKLAQSIISMIS